eukprot:scaffold4034_cov179-Amphora_coffeaeformis.AAC.2
MDHDSSTDSGQTALVPKEAALFSLLGMSWERIRRYGMGKAVIPIERNNICTASIQKDLHGPSPWPIAKPINYLGQYKIRWCGVRISA